MKTIAGTVFNQKKLVEDLNIDIGTTMCCECNANEYCFGPVGHVVTGDLSIIKDAKLRHLIKDHYIGNRIRLTAALLRDCAKRQ